MTAGVSILGEMRELIWGAVDGEHVVWWDAVVDGVRRKVDSRIPESGEGMSEARDKARERLLG